jgi:sugar-phosphatase
VVTSAGRELARVRLAAGGIRARHVVTIDDVSRGKPDPEPFLLGAKLLGVEPARCLVFEDAPAGLTAARAAGALTVAVTTTHAAAELDADLVVPDLSALRIERVGDSLLVATR